MTCSAATLSAASTMAASTSTPSPVRRRCSSASSRALSAWIPAFGSPTEYGSYGVAVGIAGQPTESGGVLDDVGERRIVAPRAVEAESGHPHHDRVGAQRLHRREVQADVVEHPRREVLDDHVAGRDQPAQQFPATLGLEVERQALLVGVQTREDRRLLPPLVLGGGDAGDEPGTVRPGGGLEVDHLGAEHREHMRAGRAGPEGGHVQHAQAAERQPVRGSGPQRRAFAAASSAPR